jgi:hypothetical protein
MTSMKLRSSSPEVESTNRQGEVVLRASLIEISEVYTHPLLAAGLLHHYHVLLAQLQIILEHQLV